MWKRLNFCGSESSLKKEAESGSKLGSILFFEELETEAFFIKHAAGIWKRLNFCGSGSKKYSTASTSLVGIARRMFHLILH